MLRKLMSTSLAMDATTLTLRLCKAQIRLECPPSLTRTISLETIQKFPPLVQWLDTLDTQTLNAKDKIAVDKITVQSIDEFSSGKIGFLKFTVSATHTAENKQLPGTVFLRGGSVAMLIILRTSVDEKRKHSFQDHSFVLLTEQPRMAAPAFNMVEIPAGMLDDHTGEFAGTAAREIQEETGLVFDSSELIDLTPRGDEPHGLFPSVGACDERIHFFACEKVVTDEQLEQLRGKLSGLRNDGELITLRLVKMCDLWRETRDMKATTAMYLWDRWVHEQSQ
ncbi:hypothetical protein GGF49_003698 [Coemansia sp. RSA 1853]|nr:hypothetical protein LPJ76_003668 [Coemansia sp. RSA 638]KAJ2541399.1 hypothetical protein GGF49_003698 [Coemansia sp. RSA 1853]